MEKFGIFELLDALSAMAAAAEKPSPPEKEEPKEETRGGRVPDPSFAPPAYDGTPAPLPSAPANALGDFLARHDAVAGKAKHKPSP